MIDPKLLTCAHRKCRHLTSGGHCGLLLAGQRVLLNARGQCEMVEEREPFGSADAPAGRTCGHYHCSQAAMSFCAQCSKAICALHRRWVPTGAVDDKGEIMQVAYCDVCTLRLVHQIANSDAIYDDHCYRDDYDDPDDPWQPV